MARLQELLTQSVVQNLGLSDVIRLRQQQAEQMGEAIRRTGEARAQEELGRARVQRARGEELGSLIGAGVGALAGRGTGVGALQGAALGSGIGQQAGGVASGRARQPGMQTGGDVFTGALQGVSQMQQQRAAQQEQQRQRLLRERQQEQKAAFEREKFETGTELKREELELRRASAAQKIKSDLSEGKIKKSQAISSLRKEFSNDPVIKDTKAINQNMARLENVWEDFTSAKNANQKERGKIAVDQALVITFNKMLDPGSVVRESEFARTPEGQGTIDRAQGFLERLEAGGTGLTDRNREEIIRVARLLSEAQNNEAKKTSSFYENEAIESGIDRPERVTGGLSFMKERPKRKSGRKALINQRKKKVLQFDPVTGEFK